MSTPATEPPTVIALPAWQVMLVLIGVPALYIANSLLPWSIGLFQKHDHAFFLEFWVSIAIRHWGTVALIVMLLKRSGGHLADIEAKPLWNRTGIDCQDRSAAAARV